MKDSKAMRTFFRGIEIGKWDRGLDKEFKGESRSKLYRFPRIYLNGYKIGYFGWVYNLMESINES